MGPSRPIGKVQPTGALSTKSPPCRESLDFQRTLKLTTLGHDWSVGAVVQYVAVRGSAGLVYVRLCMFGF